MILTMLTAGSWGQIQIKVRAGDNQQMKCSKLFISGEIKHKFYSISLPGGRHIAAVLAATHLNPSPIQRTPHAEARLLHHMRINLRGRNICMSQKLLHYAQVGAVI